MEHRFDWEGLKWRLGIEGSLLPGEWSLQILVRLPGLDWSRDRFVPVSLASDAGWLRDLVWEEGIDSLGRWLHNARGEPRTWPEGWDQNRARAMARVLMHGAVHDPKASGVLRGEIMEFCEKAAALVRGEVVV